MRWAEEFPFLPIVGVAAALTLIFANSFWLEVITSSFVAAIAIAGLGLLYGRLGLIALNQYALVGLGGWIAVRLDAALAAPFEVTALASGFLVAAIGVVWGLPALRFRGVMLALVTLMMAGAFQVFIVAVGFPEGGPGFFGRMANGGLRVAMSRPLLAQGDRAYFVYVCVWLVLALALLEWHQRTRPARAWALIRRDERMAEVAGVPILLVKAWAFALAGFLAGVSGALLAGLAGQLDGTSFTAVSSLLLFAICVIAGAGNAIGAIAGGLILKAPPALLATSGLNGFLAQVLLGALLLQSLLAGPDGAAGDLARLARRLKKR